MPEPVPAHDEPPRGEATPPGPSRGPTPAAVHVTAPLLFTLLIAAGAQVTVPMVPVPMTLQTLAVLAAGLLLGPGRGALAAWGYLALVLLGLPVLADGASAPGADFLVLRSAGYVVGFVPGAWVAGRLGAGRGGARAVGAGLAGHAVVLTLGVSVLARSLGLQAAVEHGLVPFLPGAVVKSLVAAGLAWGLSAGRR